MLRLFSLLVAAAYSISLEFNVNVSVFGCPVPVPARCSCRPSHTSKCVARRAEVSGVSTELESAVIAHIGRTADLRVVPFSEAVLSCPEDWSTAEIAGSWGGDAGEIVLALAVAEKIREDVLSQTQVASFVRAYISKSRSPHIYWHTTARAAGWVQAHLGEETLDFARPPRALEAAILAALHDPRGQGCSLMRLLLASPSQFRVRAGLVHAFIDAFHRALWDPGFEHRRKIQYHVDRDESACAIGGATSPSGPTSPPALQCPSMTPTSVSAPLPYGPFTAVLASPGGRLGSAAAFRLESEGRSASLLIHPRSAGASGRGGGTAVCHSKASGDSAAASAKGRAAVGSPLLRVQASRACERQRRAPLVPPNAGKGGRSFLVVHPQVISARRNATVPLLLAAVPGGDSQQLRNALHDSGRDWAQAIEASLAVTEAADVLIVG